MRTADIAKRYLDYFAKHDHLVMPSASLISPNPTTLFTIAGSQVPFVPTFLVSGPAEAPLTSNQEVRAHARHRRVSRPPAGTFFRCGNPPSATTSKEEAIHYAWELLTTPQNQGGYGFDPEKLWVTTFTDDEEARSIWKNERL